MNDFQEKASALSKLHIELNFPEIDANFQDPSFFELIYNRSVLNISVWVCPILYSRYLVTFSL